MSNVADSAFRQLYSGIVCAEPLTSSPEILQRFGLIHLFVVSGSHLLLLFSLFRWIQKEYKTPEWILLAVVLFYCAVCSWDIPILLATIRFIIGHLHQKLKWGWSNSALDLHCGLLTFCFCETKWHLLSLALSWTAGLAIRWASVLFKNPRHLWEQATVYIVMLPLLAVFASVHPATVLSNLLFGPLLNLLLLPITLLLCWSPLTVAWLDHMMHGFFQLLRYLDLPAWRLQLEQPSSYLSLYPLVLNCLWYSLWRIRK